MDTEVTHRILKRLHSNTLLESFGVFAFRAVHAENLKIYIGLIKIIFKSIFSHITQMS